MYGFSIFYIEALVACILFFGVLLVHNHYNIDRQEKQIKLDYALVAFIVYFLADCFWAAIEDGLIPKTRFTVVLDTFALYFFISAICYFWLQFILALEQVPHRDRPINRFAVLFPFLVTTLLLILNYIIAPQMIISDDLDTQVGFSIYLMTPPVAYLAAALFYTIRMARREMNPLEKRKHLFAGFLPLLTLAAGMIQEAFVPYIPIYCFVDALLVLMFYIQSIESRISLDSLTNLNNRGEMMRYISQRSNIYQEGRLTVVVMMDINGFKMINDTYGHAEGDRALMIIADVLKKVIRGYSMPSFLGRYGGDEFIYILHPAEGEDVELLIQGIRRRIRHELSGRDVPYALSLSLGHDVLAGDEDTIQDCFRRADKKLYEDKRGLG